MPALSSPLAKLKFLLVPVFGLATFACKPGGVGDPCIPEDEYLLDFAGYSETEVNVESRSFQCETRVCLVNHFRGRASCPYGQTDATAQANLAKPAGEATGGDACRIPGTTGSNPTDRIGVQVPPQITQRNADKTVYCSCRCANVDGSKDDGARYCDCPSGYSCEKLIDDLGFGSTQLAGSYCIKDDSFASDGKTPWLPNDPKADCSRDTANCGNNGNNP
jgi:hypothetical protein